MEAAILESLQTEPRNTNEFSIIIGSILRKL